MELGELDSFTDASKPKSAAFTYPAPTPEGTYSSAVPPLLTLRYFLAVYELGVPLIDVNDAAPGFPWYPCAP